MRPSFSKGGVNVYKKLYSDIGGSRVRADGLVFCRQCQQWKAPNAFGLHDKCLGGLKAKCKICESEANKTRAAVRRGAGLCIHCGKSPISIHSTAHCEKCRDTYNRFTNDRKRATKARAVALLGGACADCGLRSDREVIYDFHHLPGKAKTQEISNLLLGHSWARIEKELLSCALLCGNCHRIRHDDEKLAAEVTAHRGSVPRIRSAVSIALASEELLEKDD
jgi:hypothetical protein